MSFNKHYLDKYIGMMYIKCCDEIQVYADQHHKTVLAREPTDFNIDIESDRINVWLDRTGVVDHFTYG